MGGGFYCEHHGVHLLRELSNLLGRPRSSLICDPVVLTIVCLPSVVRRRFQPLECVYCGFPDSV